MNQQLFEAQHTILWDKMEQWLLIALANPNSKKLPPYEGDFSHDYRHLCQHLSLARERLYSSHLIERLHQLTMNAHQILYAAKSGYLSAFILLLIRDFPYAIRQDIKLVFICGFLFFGTGLLSGLVTFYYPEAIYLMMDDSTVQKFEAMYEPTSHHFYQSFRGSDSDIAMFGYYIQHNISIDFQVFAGGILFCLGTLFYLFFNGVFIGAVAGHITQVGSATTFFPFIIGHGAFELSALIFASVAGMKLGIALISPGRLSRTRALQQAARQSIVIVYGVIIFSVLAAFIEAFWSSSTFFSHDVKYLVGTFFWLLVLLYFLLLGKHHET